MDRSGWFPNSADCYAWSHGYWLDGSVYPPSGQDGGSSATSREAAVIESEPSSNDGASLEREKDEVSSEYNISLDLNYLIKQLLT